MGFYTVIGLGRFGSRIAEELSGHNSDVLAIDQDGELIDKIADKVTRAVVADAKNKDTLKSLGVADSDCAIVAIASDLAASVLITMNLKSLGVKKIVCKAYDNLHREILEKLGADQVVIPEQVVADKLAVNLTSPDVLEYINLSSDYGIMELVAPKEWEGKNLRELNVRAKYGVNIIAVRAGDRIFVTVDPERKTEKDDILVLLGAYPNLEKVKKLD